MASTAILGWLIGRERKFDTSEYDTKINGQVLQLTNLETEKETQVKKYNQLTTKFANLERQHRETITKFNNRPPVEIKEVPVEPL